MSRCKQAELVLPLWQAAVPVQSLRAAQGLQLQKCIGPMHGCVSTVLEAQPAVVNK